MPVLFMAGLILTPAGIRNVGEAWGVALVIAGLPCTAIAFYMAPTRLRAPLIGAVAIFWYRPLADRFYGGDAPVRYQLAVGALTVVVLSLLVAGPARLSRSSKRGEDGRPPMAS